MGGILNPPHPALFYQNMTLKNEIYFPKIFLCVEWTVKILAAFKLDLTGAVLINQDNIDILY